MLFSRDMRASACRCFSAQHAMPRRRLLTLIRANISPTSPNTTNIITMNINRRHDDMLPFYLRADILHIMMLLRA